MLYTPGNDLHELYRRSYMSNIDEPYKHSAEGKRNIHKGAGIIGFHLKEAQEQQNHSTLLWMGCGCSWHKVMSRRGPTNTCGSLVMFFFLVWLLVKRGPFTL